MQYDPKLVAVTFAGILIDGYADGSFIEIEYRNDLWDILVGADGFGVFAKSNDKSAIVTVRLMPGASANAALSAKVAADLTSLNAGFGPLSIFDSASLSQHTAPRARIMKPPSRTYAKTVEAIEYQFGCLELIPFNGATPQVLI